ncbi:MAG: phytanoyl-CoA dioxygenase family protein [Xanthomonadales bacterium]|nr:phytanoyl-CoA dioxygenase family protein [Gammaproteobacteria bacterium]MBT8053618.1 phytanoyl-CoA dioxygenase family protein [Gammaproteobacteria bacterium]NND58604.1 phytanoyl-CoA dioxygenase family protein [Xanthomonadales bacterium]NNK51006.1 phytanoyl-CoA dioxygenase family protein [Xanthomonadales bacterium]
MNSHNILSPQQIEQFQRDGYLVVRGMYSPEEIANISAWTGEVASWPEVPGKYMMYFESSQSDGSRILCRIENFVPYHEGFSKLITARRMQQAVSELFGEVAVLFKDKINFKLPGGDGFKEHQDVQAGWDDYADIHITAMIAIDETNEENGSLEMIAGMHRQGVLGSMWAPLTDADTGHARYLAVHCKPGDAVFFDSYAPHRSQPNRTPDERRVLYITYNKASDGDSREQYYTDKRNNYPPDIERDPDKDYSFKV